MDRWRGKTAIVTGASRGIGREIAERLLREGVNVVGIARSADQLQQLASSTKSAPGQFHPMPCDVTNEQHLLDVFSKVDSTLGGVHILVNNAAVLFNDSIIESTTERYRKMLDVNVLAVAICTRESIKSMRKRKIQGHVININSVAGHYAEMINIPLNLYCATKYAVNAMTTSLRHELSTLRSNIKITSISPGAVRTDMIVDVGFPKNLLDKAPMLDAKDIGDSVIYALATPPGVQINELIITHVEKLDQNTVTSK